MPVSDLPTTAEIEPVFLLILSDRKVHKFSDVVDELAERFSLTAEELDERTPSGQKRFYLRVGYAGQNLKGEGLIVRPQRGYCQLKKEH